jgi:hypothetical protein
MALDQHEFNPRCSNPCERDELEFSQCSYAALCEPKGGLCAVMHPFWDPSYIRLGQGGFPELETPVSGAQQSLVNRQSCCWINDTNPLRRTNENWYRLRRSLPCR